MQIRTLKVVEYRGSLVYFRNFGSIFEYIAVIRGQVYTAHAIIRRTLIQTLLGKDYTEKQLSDSVKYLMSMAEATIDYVLTPSASPPKEQEKKKGKK